MNTGRYRLRLGIFVLLSLGLLAGLIFWFGGRQVSFGPRVVYQVRFADAPGVSVGTPVRKSGIRIGEVSSVELEPSSGEVVVGLRVDPKFAPRAGEEPSIVRGLFVNDTSIDLTRTRADRIGDILPAGAELRGLSVTSSNPMTAFQDMVPDVQKSLEQIRKSLQKLDETIPKVNQTLEEFTLLARDTRGMIPDLRKTNDSLQSVLQDAKNAMPEFNKTNKALQDAAGDARTTLKTANTWIDETGQLIRRNEPKLVKVLDNATNALDNVARLFDDENRKNATDLLKNLSDASKSLERGSRATEEFFKDGRNTLQKVTETLTNADLAIGDIRSTTKPIGEKMGKVMENIDVASREFAGALTDARELMRVLTRADGTIAKFLNDPALYNNLNEASIQFMKVMPRVDRMFRDLEVFADKIARHPESIGVGGALRPSAGFKEAPETAPAATYGPIVRPRYP